MVTRKSRAEIERMRRAGRVVGEVLDLIEAELRAGRLDRATSTPSPRRTSGPSGGDAVVQGLPGHQPAPAVPGQRLHLDRRRDRPRHPRPPHHPRRPDRVGRRRRHRRRLARRRGPDLLRRRAAARGRPADRPDPRGDDGRDRRGRARATTSTTSRPRSRPSPGAAGLGRHPPVRRPRHRDRDARGAAGPELPHRPPGPQARARAVPGDRADVHPRRLRHPDPAGRLDGRHR